MHLARFAALVALLAAACAANAQYNNTWASLDSRPLPGWYDQAKFGIFVHWGVFSVPAYGGAAGSASAEWYWYYYNNADDPQLQADYRQFQSKYYGSNFQYADFASQFNAYFFNASEWASLFAASGAKYVVLTSKHHEGFANWPSNVSWNWNAWDVGPHRDLVGELTAAVKDTGLVMGLYHSLFEWFNPIFLQDEANGFATNEYVTDVLQRQLRDIVTNYQPWIVWSDGEWDASSDYWQSRDFLAWLYNSSPVANMVVTNDRWGNDTVCAHGGYWTCMDRYNPGYLVPHKWENCASMDSLSWGYSRTSPLSNYLTLPDLLRTLISTVAYGGNLLLNVGPTADGRIPLIFQERLLEIGAWLEVNGGAIYGTSPFRVQNETSDGLTVFYTSKGSTVYAHVLSWPGMGGAEQLKLAAPIVSAATSVGLLGLPIPLSFDGTPGQAGLAIDLPLLEALSPKLGPAYVFAMEHVS